MHIIRMNGVCVSLSSRMSKMANVQMPLLIVAATAAIAITSALIYKRKRRNQPPTEWKPVAKVTKIYLYPLKSGRRIELNLAECSDFGLMQSSADSKGLQLCDRSFVVYSEGNNEFKTARQHPRMVLMAVSNHDAAHIKIDAPGMNTLVVKVPTSSDVSASHIKLHRGEKIYSLDCGDEAATWVSNYILGKSNGLRLGYHDSSKQNHRKITDAQLTASKVYKNLKDETMGLYSDLTAIMLMNQASVDDLNRRITGTHVVAENFRPCIIVEGPDAPPFVEDDWDWIKIGDAVFRNVKPCTRCVMTTVDPETGVMNQDREPLRTLEKYRRLKELKNIDHEGKSTVMGCNLGINIKGTIKVNDTVYIG